MAALHASGRHAESDAALAELIDRHGDRRKFEIVGVLAIRDEPDRAFEWLEKAIADKNTALCEIGYAPEQVAAIRFDISLPKTRNSSPQ